MRTTLLVLLFTACLPPQRLESPCVGQPASIDGGACPACSSDADCAIRVERLATRPRAACPRRATGR